MVESRVPHSAVEGCTNKLTTWLCVIIIICYVCLGISVQRYEQHKLFFYSDLILTAELV